MYGRGDPAFHVAYAAAHAARRKPAAATLFTLIAAFKASSEFTRALVSFEMCDPIDGAELLDDITRTILRYLALPETTAQTVAVWAVHTHCYDAFTISPRLAIT